MNHPTDRALHDYLDDALTPAARAAVEAHLADCDVCEAEVTALRMVTGELATLPDNVPPPYDLWPAIEARLTPRTRRTDRRATPLQRRWPARAVAVSVLTLFLAVGAWLARNILSPSGAGWAVAALDGDPTVGSRSLGGEGRLYLGEWLETDAGDRAVLDVGLIGHVEVGPDSRVQLRSVRPADHRLRMERGTLHARIWAPPRLFFVETPSALAIDLGCEYTLEVDGAGASLLHVTAGYVELVHKGRTTLVPAGAMALAKPDHGPGTPFADDAPDVFRRALARYDFDDSNALPDVLNTARAADVLSLWHLLARTDGPDQAQVYDRLATLVPPPPGVTRDGVLGGDATMIHAWQTHLGFHDLLWLELWL